ncbi:uncharacterized protein CC84DRAFT_417256 [Paraphaeosphaeria sporulosa]|uniref:Uncharacterized protein n=1 Tax=Paraphaeosphaeria sporulosa TaxID=1460663 RepID=A0A177BUJ8_9PLEO|nr:uncharacterized protein CC84DRAFT_417256 [Paraphaeosphaeria sporulosa]OAF99122.1 hypothetical protein CC84DRAFT_417256 [Paraphaeosphaeria sporulosa]
MICTTTDKTSHTDLPRTNLKAFLSLSRRKLARSSRSFSMIGFRQFHKDGSAKSRGGHRARGSSNILSAYLPCSLWSQALVPFAITSVGQLRAALSRQQIECRCT